MRGSHQRQQPLATVRDLIGQRSFHYGLSMRDIGYATECLKMEATADGAVVDAFTIYKDRSGRPDRHRLYVFQRSAPDSTATAH